MARRKAVPTLRTRRKGEKTMTVSGLKDLSSAADFAAAWKRGDFGRTDGFPIDKRGRRV